MQLYILSILFIMYIWVEHRWGYSWLVAVSEALVWSTYEDICVFVYIWIYMYFLYNVYMRTQLSGWCVWGCDQPRSRSGNWGSWPPMCFTICIWISKHKDTAEYQNTKTQPNIKTQGHTQLSKHKDTRKYQKIRTEEKKHTNTTKPLQHVFWNNWYSWQSASV